MRKVIFAAMAALTMVGCEWGHDAPLAGDTVSVESICTAIGAVACERFVDCNGNTTQDLCETQYLYSCCVEGMACDDRHTLMADLGDCLDSWAVFSCQETADGSVPEECLAL